RASLAAECQATYSVFRFVNPSFRARRRSMLTITSNDVTPAAFVATPPDRQLFPLQGQFVSFGASSSLQPLLLAAKRGAMTIVSSSAWPRNAAATAVVK